MANNSATGVARELHETTAGPPTMGFCAATAFQKLRRLSDAQLLVGLNGLVQKDHGLTVEILLHLGEVEARGLHHQKACSSLFSYSVERLGFSEEVAYKRVGAARLGRRFPLALELLAQGRLHLTALMLVRPHLTEENYREWLLAACGKTKREVELLVAARCPRPDVPSSVRKLPRAAASATAVIASAAAASATGPTLPKAVADLNIEADVASSGLPLPRPMTTATRTEVPAAVERPAVKKADIPRVEPLSGASYRVSFTASGALKKKLDHAADLVSHSVTQGDLPALIERAVDGLIEREEKRRFAVHAPNRTSVKGAQDRGSVKGAQARGSVKGAQARGSADEAPGNTELEQDPDLVPSVQQSRRFCWPVARDSRYVPADVRRSIWQRDEGRCSYVDADGHRCQERRLLQIEHRDPHARGGASTRENCCLLCRGHNQHRAREEYGEAALARGRARSKTQRGARPHMMSCGH